MAAIENLFESDSDSDGNFDGFHESDLDNNDMDQSGYISDDVDSDIDV
jgi:hypothetical protein